MCTVSYIPSENGYILTSSRDEKMQRPTAIPEKYTIKDNLLIFPKDLQSGGTWIALCPDKKRVACLLNGAFENHQKATEYRLSRGQILLDSFIYPNAEIFNAFIDLSNIEPFTLILIENSKRITINEIKWDGKEKHYIKIDTSKPKIWSSATLYDKHIREQREQWLTHWLTQNEALKIANFHITKHGNDQQNDVVMQREGGLQTLSISQIRCTDDDFVFDYIDLVQNKTYSIGYD